MSVAPFPRDPKSPAKDIRDEIERHRRYMLNPKPGVEARTILKNAAAALFVALAVDGKAYPEAREATLALILERLDDLAGLGGVPAVEAEAIVAAAMDAARESREQPKANGKAGNGKDQVVLARMADVAPQAIDWLWTGRLARRKLTLLTGDPGLGKSQLSLDMAARISKGGRWPDGGAAPPGNVVILSAEDDLEDTLRPRCEAAGADLARVHALRAVVCESGSQRTFSLQRDLDALALKINAIGAVSLVIIDPITAYLGDKLDTHQTAAVRGVLAPLAAFAERHGVALLAVSHPPKAAPAKALHAVTGSYAFVAAARLTFLVIEEAETDRRLMLAVKSNVSALAPGLAYRLAQCIVAGNIVASHIVWDDGPVTMSANEALAAMSNNTITPALAEAKDFLRDELDAGPLPQKELRKRADGAGLSWATIRRAKDKLGIRPRKSGLQDGWVWALPDAKAEGAQPPEDAQP